MIYCECIESKKFHLKIVNIVKTVRKWKMVKKLWADRGEGRNIGIWGTGGGTKNTKIIPPRRYKIEQGKL